MTCSSRYSVDWLDTATNPKPLYHNPATVPRVHWDASLSLDSVPAVDYSQLLQEDRLSSKTRERASGDRVQRPVLKQLLANLLCYGFAFIDNTPTNLDGTMSATGIVSFPQAIKLQYTYAYVLSFS